MIAVVAIGVIVLGCTVAIVIDSRPLASATVPLGGSSVSFQITQRDGAVFIAAAERKAGTNGRFTKMLVGHVDKIGMENPSIENGNEVDVVRLRVGTAVVDFDFKTWSFKARS